MSLLNVQDAIVTQLKTLPQTVYDDGVPEDTRLVFAANGMMLPYIVVEHSGATLTADGQPITGVKDGSSEASISVMCIGPTQRSSRQVSELVRQKLTGFNGVEFGELKPVSAPYTYIDGRTQPVRYVSETVFGFTLNSVW
jgi:hypothetical protein